MRYLFAVPRHSFGSYGGRQWGVYLLLVVLAGCDASKEAPQSAPKRPAVPVETEQVASADVGYSVEAIGTLLGNESVSITAKVTDQIAHLHFEDGDRVKAGEILVELTNSEQTALQREAEANLREAELQLERLRKLGSDISTVAQIDVADARVKASEAKVDAIKARIEDHLIRAPFDGVLGFRQVSPGALVTPGTVIAELDDVHTLKLDFTVPEVYLSKVKRGDRLVSTSSAWPGEEFSGEVASIGSRIDEVTRAFSVRALIDNGAGRLRPGMLLSVTVIGEAEAAIVVPEQALMQRGRQSSVYLVDDKSQVQRAAVEIGRRVPGGIVIRSGLSEGQRIVVNGQLSVRPGASVTEAVTEQGSGGGDK
jgi:membrane fusion protein, multidrug efflux system